MPSRRPSRRSSLFPSSDALERIAKGQEAASALAPGRGHLDLKGYAAPGRAGLTVELSARINKILSGYGYGRVGTALGRTEYEAGAGVRAEW